jgi:putative membrane protein
MFDLVMAISHHLSVFALFGVLFAEFVSVRRGMDAAAVARVARVDLWYGVLAGLIVVVGFVRAIFAAKGWP